MIQEFLRRLNFPGWKSKVSACEVFPSTNDEKESQNFRQANAQYFVF